MKLESRVLSHPSVIKATEEFVVVKIDPNETNDAREHKTTGYVPELVVLDSRQNFVRVIDERDPKGVARALREALEEAKRR